MTRVSFTPAQVRCALDDELAWYGEHHHPDTASPLPDDLVDPAIEKLLSVAPHLGLEQALRFGFSVATRLRLSE